MEILLASASPRRKDLLSLLTDSFSVYHTSIDETPLPGEDPFDYCMRVSKEKSEAAAAIPGTGQNRLVISADTTVILEKQILGKPAVLDEAAAMLGELSGKEHTVATALTCSLSQHGSEQIITGVETTLVRFKALTPEIIHSYLADVRWDDKAGGYAIQEKGSVIIEGITGSMSNVIGFPLGRFITMAIDHGFMEKLLTPAR